MSNTTWDPVKQTGMSPAKAALASVHQRGTLPGHDPSKVRDCITDSASEALDVRVLQVAEWLADTAAVLMDARFVTLARTTFDQAETLRAIAAEIRDAATPRRPVAECNDVIAIWTADTATELRDVWSGSSARRPEMEPIERIRLLEKAMGRLLVIEARHEGDGR